MDSPLLYVLLGTPGAGRRTLLLELAGALRDEQPGEVLALVQEEESVRAEIPPADGLSTAIFRVVEGRIVLSDDPAFPEAPGFRAVFVLFDGLGDLATQMEALAGWLPQAPFELGRILAVVDCALATREPKVLPWLEGCLHFSDLALLNHREGVSNRWIADFQEYYRKACFPTLFRFVKKGRVPNPAEVLFPEARRLSQIFEPREDLSDIEVFVEEDAGEDDDDFDPEEDLLPPEEDRFLKRNAGGRRMEPLPDLRKLLLAGD